MTVTLIQMFQQGMIFHLIAMLLLFVLMVIMINRIGSGKAAVKDAQPETLQVQKTGNMSAITAAITAAVAQYKKNN